jgi:RND family efflux transporter MFP subunit
MYRRNDVGRVCTALCAIAVSLACSTHEAQQAAPSPVPVKVEPVSPAADVTLARYSGSLEPIARVDMAFRVGGYVDRIGQIRGEDGALRTLAEGDFVTRGSMLARIRSEDYSQKVATARAGLGQARSEAKLAEMELGRSQKLFAANAISKAELDAKLARAEYARANVDASAARVNEAGVALDDAVLRAPMDGVILARDLEVGALVSPGRTVLTVADVGRVKARFAVPEAVVEKLSLGSPVSVHVGAERETRAPQRALDARVTRIAPAADSRGRVFTIEAELSNADGSLRPGTVISVRVPEATLATAAASVPLSAIVRSPADPRGFAVYVLEGAEPRGTVRLAAVKLGEVLGNAVTVESGLRAGQRVVTIGSTLVRDGGEAVVIPSSAN